MVHRCSVRITRSASAAYHLSATHRAIYRHEASALLKGSRQVGAMVMVSERALMVVMPLMSLRSSVKNGTRPQRASINSRSPDSQLCRMIGWCVVGAPYSTHPAAADQQAEGFARNCSARFCLSLLRTYRAHMSLSSDSTVGVERSGHYASAVKGMVSPPPSIKPRDVSNETRRSPSEVSSVALPANGVPLRSLATALSPGPADAVAERPLPKLD